MKAKRPKYRRVQFVVSFTIPRGATIAECRAYVEDWVQSGRGALRPPGGEDENDPGDPMWRLDTNSVKVTRYNARKKDTNETVK